MSTSVKHIHSGMRGAPTINGTAGTQIAALDALFVTGWGATTALSITVAGGIATAQLTPGETFDRTAVVLVAGATPAELNGESRVLTTSNTAITWATTAADGVATGTITIKYAPQTSWAKVYAGTNKAVYRSGHVQSNGHYLRVDDTGTTTARVRGYESMTDVETGVGPFPTDAQMSGGGYIWKSQSAGATAVKYRIFCDERFVVFAISAGSSSGPQYNNAAPFGFGDPIVLAPGGDAWGTLLSAGGATLAAPTGANLVANTDSSATALTVAPRAINGLGSAVLLNVRAFVSSASTSGSDTLLGVLPSEVDGQVKYSNTFVRDSGAGKPPRATIPGVFFIPQSNAAGTLVDGDIMAGSDILSGRKLMVVSGPGGQYNQTTTTCYLVDITGPWR